MSLARLLAREALVQAARAAIALLPQHDRDRLAAEIVMAPLRCRSVRDWNFSRDVGEVLREGGYELELGFLARRRPPPAEDV